MYDFQISTGTIAVLVIDIVIGLLLTFGPAIFLAKKYKTSSRAYVIGVVTMIIFAYIIEGLFNITIAGMPVGQTIYSNVFIKAVYGAFMAALFEEGGRFVAMRFWLHREKSNDLNAFMYGCGHGGLEAFTILVYSMGVTVYYALLIKNGQLDSMMSTIDENSKNVLIMQAETIAGTNSLVYLVAAFERLAALATQLSLSMFVWLGVRKPEKRYYIAIAFVAHFIEDFIAGYLGTKSIAVTEIIIGLMSAGLLYLAITMYRQNKQNEQKNVTELV